VPSRAKAGRHRGYQLRHSCCQIGGRIDSWQAQLDQPAAVNGQNTLQYQLGSCHVATTCRGENCPHYVLSVILHQAFSQQRDPMPGTPRLAGRVSRLPRRKSSLLSPSTCISPAIAGARLADMADMWDARMSFVIAAGGDLAAYRPKVRT
jgi:hypothetical protein